MPVTVIAEGLDDLIKYAELAPQRSLKAAYLALNQIGSGKGLTLLRHEINDDSAVFFPSGYVNKDRLYLAKRATADDLEINITARDRPTSLARFAEPSTPIRGKSGVTVTVHRGKQTKLKKAFLIPLQNGNLGLAVRLKTGQTFRETTGAVEIESARTSTSQLYLLYGPSVDQVFTQTAEENVPELLEMISGEFVRQFGRDNL